jgi:Tfp pilus assembly protein PilO
MHPFFRPSPARLNYAAHGAGLAVALAVAALWGVAMGGVADYRAELIRSRAEAEDVSRNDASTRTRHAELSGRLAVARRRSTELRSRLTAAAGETRFLVQLADAAAAANVELGGVQPGQKTVRDGLGQLHVNLHGSGSFAAIASFLVEVQKLPRACFVSSLKISADDTAVLRGELALHLLFGRPAGEGQP